MNGGPEGATGVCGPLRRTLAALRIPEDRLAWLPAVIIVFQDPTRMECWGPQIPKNWVNEGEG
jgi:hypothetical protein